MNITNIILLTIGAAILGGIIVFVVVKLMSRKNTQQNNIDKSSYKNEIESLKQALSEKEKAYSELKEKLKTVKNGGNVTITSDEEDRLKDEISKAKEKIKKLENEIEDLEDECDDQKKKTKKIEAEKDEIIGQLENKNKQISSELQETKDTLNEAREEISLKQQSLSFVQEVMTAKRADDKSYSERIKAIREIKDYIEEDLEPFVSKNFNDIREGSAKWNEYFGPQLSEWAEIASKHWVQGKVKIAFVGEFSAGKTSIVNRILSQNDASVQLLPVSTEATTAIPTYISGGITTTYCLYSPDNILKTISKETFSRVNKEVLNQVKGISSLIQYFVMTYKNPNLNGMSILDTPGFNSNDKEDSERTLGVINECDALFWVVDVNTGTINRSSLALIKEKLKKPLYVVINKTDTKAEKEVERVEQLIKQTFAREGVVPKQYIRFSKTAQIDTIMNVVKSIRRSADSENYVNNLVNNLVPSCLSILREIVNRKNSEHSNARKSCESLENSFYEVLSSMADKCDTAKRIPHWETYFFRKDRYEMTESQGDRLINLLGLISEEDAPRVKKMFSENVEAAKRLQKTHEDLSDCKTILREMESHQSKLVGLINKLNK
ncbi:MAG: dynamin family protein [Bacteroidales bacterium]|nr:dynamin family protein [Bacteroidales bacterium]